MRTQDPGFLKFLEDFFGSETEQRAVCRFYLYYLIYEAQNGNLPVVEDSIKKEILGHYLVRDGIINRAKITLEWREIRKHDRPYLDFVGTVSLANRDFGLWEEGIVIYHTLDRQKLFSG